MARLRDRLARLWAGGAGIGRNRARLLAVVWGVLLCASGTWYLDRVSPGGPNVSWAGEWQLMGIRQKELERTYWSLDHGLPPLVAVDRTPAEQRERLTDRETAERIHASGVSDDQGIYVWMPILRTVVGGDDPRDHIRVMYLALFAVVLLAYPLLLLELFGSLGAAMLGPLPLPMVLDSLASGDIYFIGLWYSVLCLPVLSLIHVRWPKGTWPAWAVVSLFAVIVVGSFTNTIRSGTALAALVAAVGMVLFKRLRWWSALATLAILAVGYISISGFGMGGVRAYRNASVNNPAVASAPKAHVFWHIAYIGIGFEPNGYGIHYSDTVSERHAERERPGVERYSKEYERTLRGLYWRTARGDPLLIIRGLAKKTVVVVGDGFRDAWPVALLLPFMLMLGRRRAEMVASTIIAAPALVIGAAPAVVAVPTAEYEQVFLGAVVFLLVLCFAWFVTILVDLASARLAGKSSGGRPRPERRLTALARFQINRRVLVAFALCGLLVAVGVASAVAGDEYRSQWRERESALAAFRKHETAPRPVRLVCAWRGRDSGRRGGPAVLDADGRERGRDGEGSIQRAGQGVRRDGEPRFPRMSG